MKIKLLLFLIIFTFFNCKESNKNYNLDSTKNISVNASVKVSSKKDNKKVIHDIGGTIINKFFTGKEDYCVCGNKYFFSILLDNGKVFDWETVKVKWDRKEVNDRVHFDYIRTYRFSDKAID